MKNLQELQTGKIGIVQSVGGTPTFQRRVTSVGLTPGCQFEVVQNEGKYPLLIYVRNTLLALDRNDCQSIQVEVTA